MATKNISFEESIKELENIVNELENGEIELDKAIDKYKEAMNLSKICNDKLKNAEEAINKIVKENGEVEEFTDLEEGD